MNEAKILSNSVRLHNIKKESTCQVCFSHTFLLENFLLEKIEFMLFCREIVYIFIFISNSAINCTIWVNCKRTSMVLQCLDETSKRFWPLFESIEEEMVFCYQNFSDLLREKVVLVIEKNFWFSRLKAKNLQNLRDHENNLFQQWKGQNNLW